MIVKVAMIKNRMFLLEMDVPKCMCERWNLALAYEIWACKLYSLKLMV
jgi:hypothetical protein